MDRLVDVLETVGAGIDERDAETLAGLLTGLGRNRHAAGGGNRFEADGDVDIVAEHLVFVGHHIAHMDADSKLHDAVGGEVLFRSAIIICIAIAASMAPTMLGNSSRKPSPVFFTSRPP